MDTRTTLLDHAESLARSRGMDAFSFADLAKALDIRKASVHYHYPTKADLMLALVERYTSGVVDALPMEGSAAERLSAYLALYRVAMAEGSQVCLCVSLSGSCETLSDGVLDVINAFNQTNMAWLHGVFAQGRRDQTIAAVQDEVAEARHCLAVVEGAQLIARAAGCVRVFDEATALLRARLIMENIDASE